MFAEQGTRMDGNVLHRLFVGDGRLFVRKDVRRSIDTAIQIVLDRSGSMQGTASNWLVRRRSRLLWVSSRFPR